MRQLNPNCPLYSLTLILFVWLLGCFPNNLYPYSEDGHEIFYSTFSAKPKHFDPAIAYSSDEYRFIQKIYERPIQYHYIKRPYALVPLTEESRPKPHYFGADGSLLIDDAPPEQVTNVVYDIRIRPGIMYQPHPCFVRNKPGIFLYHNMSSGQLNGIRKVRDFPKTGTRELVAADHLLQIKRLTDPRLSGPILSTLTNYVVGMEECATGLKDAMKTERARRQAAAGVGHNHAANEKHNPIQMDLGRIPFAGIELVDRYTHLLTLKKKYPQIVHWLAMPSFAPIPQEAIDFCDQKHHAPNQCKFNHALSSVQYAG